MFWILFTECSRSNIHDILDAFQHVGKSAVRVDQNRLHRVIWQEQVIWPLQFVCNNLTYSSCRTPHSFISPLIPYTFAATFYLGVQFPGLIRDPTVCEDHYDGRSNYWY